MDREVAVFSAARRLPAGERAAYLDEACAGDATLRQRVEELLQASEEAGGFLQDPALGAQRPADTQPSPNPLPSTQAPGEKVGDRIGRYKLLQQIGEGGCGVVYMAEQEEPVRRRVALKVIKLGMDTKQVVARFEAERQALALMDHPNIAKVLEAGATDTGRPYFVMELVRGIKITHYCDENNLSTRERLDLFIKVAQAVQHAHQKGIIHRDLKPSNVLVADHDGVPVPKVIDFGIAKATTDQRLTDKTLFTAFEQFIGTPAYMSPEQARMSGLDIDTRTDIYSLGVLLYELLTGKTPFDAGELLAAGLDAMRRTISEKEPARPSTRLSTMLEGELTTTAKHRHTDAPKLVHLLRGDLDWIVMKALEKDRARRYETANGLATDIQRHLNNEPVVARPPSNLYRFQKLVRRNKLAFSFAAAISTMLVLGVVVSTWQAIRATRSEREQSRLRAAAQQAEQRATEKLWDSYLDQAHAARWSGRAGRRFKSLEAITKAAEIRPSLELRNEAIAALALVDIRVIKTPRNPNPKREFTAWDAAMEQYAVVTAGKDIVLRRATDDGELARLPAIDSAPSYPYPFSPDGAWLPVLYGDGGLRIWNVARAEPLLNVPAVRLHQIIHFHPDGRRVVIAHRSTELSIYSLANGAEVKLFPIPYPAECVRFDPSGERLAITAMQRTEALVLDANSGAVQLSLPHPAAVGEVAWHPSGERLATAGKDGMLRVWDVATGKLLRTMNGRRGELGNVAYAHRGRLLLSTDWGGLLLWDPETGERLVTLETHGGTICVSADDRRVGLVEWGQHRLGLCELALGREAQSIRVPGTNAITDATFSPDARWLACAVSDAVYLLNAESTALLVRIPATGAASVCFNPDGETLYVADARGLFAWPIHANVASGEVVFGPSKRLGSASPVRLVRSSPTGKIVAAIHDTHCHLISVETGDEVKTDAVAGAYIRSLSFSPDGRWLAAGGWNGRELKIWAATSGQQVQTLTNVDSSCAYFSPRGQWLVISDENDYIVCEAESWEPVRRIRHDTFAMGGFCPATGALAVRETKTAVRLIDPATGETIAVLEPPGIEHLRDLFFSPDGARLAATRPQAHDLLLWDIRAIRAELKRMKLDWTAPDLPPTPAPQFKGTNFIVDGTPQ